MVNKTITVCFSKCTTLLVPESWPMKAWLWDSDRWKAENLEGFCNWPITWCFIQNDRARLIIEHSTNFASSGNIVGLCNTPSYLELCTIELTCIMPVSLFANITVTMIVLCFIADTISADSTRPVTCDTGTYVISETRIQWNIWCLACLHIVTKQSYHNVLKYWDN